MALLNKRIVVKTVVWRAIATSITAVGVLVLTEDLTIAGILGLVDTTIKMGAYFIHEHFWSKTTWGRPEMYKLDQSKAFRDLGRQKQEAVDGYFGGTEE